MKITFIKLEIHRFKSFDDAVIDLTSKGFTLVSGINNKVTDNASSNGSGKSSWGDAIMWALTGETSSGISRNLANINFNSGMYVRLHFMVGNDTFIITRSKDDKELGTNLTILINGQDKSGKGIRDSEKLLSQYLPDLTPQLISSCIILGQGLPQRFTDNTPSGRKEMLEKLSKSDFMIEDIKNRLTTRKGVLSKELRNHQDALIRLESSLQTARVSRDNAANQLASLENVDEIDASIKDINSLIEVRESMRSDIISQQKQVNDRLLEIQSSFTSKSTQYALDKQEIQNAQYRDESELKDVRTSLSMQMSNIKSEISRLLSIKDTCPTCGQHIPGVIKPDVTPLQSRYDLLSKDFNTIGDRLQEISSKYVEQQKSLAVEYEKSIYADKQLQSQLSSSVRELEVRRNAVDDELRKYRDTLQALLLRKGEYNLKVENCKKIINDFEDFEKNINKDILYNKESADNISKHLEVINKITTLTTRDFRGVLLTNVINFIDRKAKEYAIEVFNTDLISFTLNNNNIDIMYDNKPVENLSGGERQKVDLIIQFSIRDMLCQFMNFSSSILILDEVFDNLDSLGVSKVLNMITRKLTDIESIYIISHHSSELDIPYDSELLIEKGEDGISRIL